VSPTENEASVTITIGQMYEVLIETRDDVREVKQVVNQLAAGQQDHEARIRHLEDNDPEDLAKRLAAAEDKLDGVRGLIARWSGAAAVLGVVGGYAIEFVATH